MVGTWLVRCSQSKVNAGVLICGDKLICAKDTHLKMNRTINAETIVKTVEVCVHILCVTIFPKTRVDA